MSIKNGLIGLAFAILSVFFFEASIKTNGNLIAVLLFLVAMLCLAGYIGYYAVPNIWNGLPDSFKKRVSSRQTVLIALLALFLILQVLLYNLAYVLPESLTYMRDGITSFISALIGGLACQVILDYPKKP